MPTNITTVIAPMIASVAAALSAFGLRKFGTPLLTASTPVRAVHPDENARSASATTSSPLTWWAGVIAVAGGLRHRRVAGDRLPGADARSSAARCAMNPYVGTANSRPDSRTPRRFITASSATKPS